VAEVLDVPTGEREAVLDAIGQSRSGVGRPVSDLIELADLSRNLALVTITSDGCESCSGYEWSVPKRNVTSAA